MSIDTKTDIPESPPLSSVDTPEPKPRAKNWVKSLDALRGFAALYVVMNHIAVLSLIPYKFIGHNPVSHITKLFSALMLGFSFGHQAVIVFFVLSGFCIHYRIASGFNAGRHNAKLDVKDYFARRAKRILPPYYFAIVFTALLSYAFLKINPDFAAHLTGYAFSDDILAVHLGWQTLLGNLVFQQWLTCATFGNNTPLWSLSYEFWFYLLYPVYIAIWRRCNTMAETGIIALVSLVCGILVTHVDAAYSWPFKIGEYWIDWCIGCLAADLYVGDKHLVMSKFLNLGVAILVMVSWILGTRALHINDAVSDFIGALASLVLVLTMLHRNEAVDNLKNQFPKWVEKQLSAVGIYSYSLYLTHVPTLCLLCAVWFTIFHHFPTNPVIPLVSVAICIIVARLSFAAVEKFTINRKQGA